MNLLRNLQSCDAECQYSKKHFDTKNGWLATAAAVLIAAFLQGDKIPLHSKTLSLGLAVGGVILVLIAGLFNFKRNTKTTNEILAPIRLIQFPSLEELSDVYRAFEKGWRRSNWRKVEWGIGILAALCFLTSLVNLVHAGSVN